jgi:hypothetical protein
LDLIFLLNLNLNLNLNLLDLELFDIFQCFHNITNSNIFHQECRKLI